MAWRDGDPPKAPYAIAAVAVIVLAILGVSSTGGEEPDPAARGEISAIVTRAVTSTDPDDCERLLTQRFLEQTEGEYGEEAVQECRIEAEQDKVALAEGIEPRTLQVHGDDAVESFEIQGGLGDGMLFTVTLVRTDGEWKLDRLSHVKVDRRRYERSQLRLASKLGLSKRQVRCSLRRQRRLITMDSVERSIVTSDSGVASAVSSPCFDAAKIEKEFYEHLRDKMRADDIPEAGIECIIDGLEARLTSRQVQAIVASHQGSRLRKLVSAISSACRDAYGEGRLPEVPTGSS